tara:strand:+ start:437 stop:1249 length:813 start_codon:yes stop_codon:yes gene_type:complete
LVNDPDQKKLQDQWNIQINKDYNLVYCENLYNGNGFKRISKILDNKEFFVVSAGLGLLSSKNKIPSYEASVKHFKEKIGLQNGVKFDYASWWKFLCSTKYSLPGIHSLVSDKDLILISVSSEYLKLIYEDLLQVKSKLIIFTGFNDQTVLKSLSQFMSPYTENFDGPDGVFRGTNRDFAQRCHADFLTRYNKFNNIEQTLESIKLDMKKWRSPIKHKNKKTTDEEIVKLIKKYIPSYNNYRDLLRYFRYDLKIACEERRFKNLFLQIKES